LQLLKRSIAAEAIFDIARARALDVTALEADIATLAESAIDFVTFGAPARYAWATIPGVRALHVIAVPSGGARAVLGGDLIRRLGSTDTDFPPLGLEDQRINAALTDALEAAEFAPSKLREALRAGDSLPPNGDVVFVEYPDTGLVSSGLGHGSYTRLDAMLFHATLIADRLYSKPPIAAPPTAWSRLRSLMETRGA
jgi:hypothetical protein